MEPVSSAIVAELVKLGTGYVLAAFFWLRYDSELKDRRATEKAATELILKIKDKAHDATIQSANSQSEILSTNARMIESHTTTQQALIAEVRELAAEIRRRPCTEGR